MSEIDSRGLSQNDQVNPDAARELRSPETADGGSGSTHCSFSAIDCDSATEASDAVANHLENMRIREELHDTILLSQEIVPEDISRYPSDHVTIVPLGFGIPEQQDHETQFVEDDLSTYLMW